MSAPCATCTRKRESQKARNVGFSKSDGCVTPGSISAGSATTASVTVRGDSVRSRVDTAEERGDAIVFAVKISGSPGLDSSSPAVVCNGSAGFLRVLVRLGFGAGVGSTDSGGGACVLAELLSGLAAVGWDLARERFGLGGAVWPDSALAPGFGCRLRDGLGVVSGSVGCSGGM